MLQRFHVLLFACAFRRCKYPCTDAAFYIPHSPWCLIRITSPRSTSSPGHFSLKSQGKAPWGRGCTTLSRRTCVWSHRCRITFPIKLLDLRLLTRAVKIPVIGYARIWCTRTSFCLEGLQAFLCSHPYPTPHCFYCPQFFALFPQSQC